MSEKEKNDLEELKKEIVIARLSQASPNIKISFGMSDGKFLGREELINQVKNNTEMGNRIIKVQLEYMKAFKKGMVVGG